MDTNEALATLKQLRPIADYQRKEFDEALEIIENELSGGTQWGTDPELHSRQRLAR